MKGYVYIESGIVVVNQEKKPELPDGHSGSENHKPEWQMRIDREIFEAALSAWKDKNIRVENACEYEEPEPPLGIVINPDSPDYDVIIEGQPVDFDITREKNCKITEI